MKPLSLSQVAQWANGELLQGTSADEVSVVSTDTRKMTGGELFIALKGENFDAHDHLEEASKKGAAAMLVHALPASTESYTGGIIRVHDTLKALQSLARNYRRHLGLKVVGITGSNGKTSTKDFTRAVLQTRYQTIATRGNLNNHFGVPLTILELETDHEVSIQEMGMSNPGEIELLAEIGQPDVGIITNIGTAHIEFMKTQDAIALEKGMLAEAIPASGCVIMPEADRYLESIRARSKVPFLTGGIDCGDVQARSVEATNEGMRFLLAHGDEEIEVTIAVPGKHMVQNATLAAAAGIHLGLSLKEIRDGLQNLELTAGRVQRREIAGLQFLDDSYNANPDSMRAALQTLQELQVQGRRIAILGRMAELGEAEEEEHRKLGKAVAEHGVDIVLGIGDQADWISEGVGDQVEAHVLDDHEAIADFLKEEAGPDDLVLLKGSRSAGMESVLTHLQSSPD